MYADRHVYMLCIYMYIPCIYMYIDVFGQVVRIPDGIGIINANKYNIKTSGINSGYSSNTSLALKKQA